MAKEFTMGARLTLTDDFSNPMREVWRATEQFRQVTQQADDSASRMVRELNDLNEAHRDVSQATKQASKAIDDATQASQQLADEQKDAHREAQELAETMQQLGKSITPAASNLSQFNSNLDPAANNLNQLEQEVQQAASRINVLTTELTQAQRAAGQYVDAAGRLRDANGRFVSSTSQAKQAANSFGQAANKAGNSSKQFADAVDDASDATNGWNSDLISLRTNIAVVGTAIAGAVGAFASMQSVDGMLGMIQAQTGKAAEEAAKLTEAAKAVYSEGWGESIPEVAKDMGILNQNIKGLSSDAAQEFLESGYILRDAFGAEITDTTRTIRNLKANFDDVTDTKALDMLTVAFQRGGDASQDLLDTVNEYSVHFANMGMSSEQMFATLIAGSEQGAFQLDKVGDAVKESFIRMQDMSKTSRDAYQMLGLDATKIENDIASGGAKANQAFMATLTALGAMESDLDRNAAGVALFGTMWEDLEDDVILAMKQGQQGLQGFEGATERAGAALRDNLGSQAQAAARGMLLAFTTAAQPVTDLLTSAFSSVNDNMGDIQAAAEDVADGIRATFDGLQASAKFVVDNWNLIGPLIEGVGAAWLVYGGYLAAVKVGTIAVAAAQSIHTAALLAYRAAVLAVNMVMLVLRGNFLALSLVMAASPIGVIVTAFGLLLAAGILVYRNWDTIRDVFIRTFGFMAPYLEPVKQAFVDFGNAAYYAVVQSYNKIAQKFTEARAWGSDLMNSLGPVGNAIKNSFTTIGNTLATLSPLIARLGLAFLGVSGPVGWVIAAVVSLGAFLFKLVNNNENVKASLLAGWESIKAGVQPLLAAFAQIGQVFITALTPAMAEFSAAFAELAPEFQKTGQIIAQSFVTLGPAFAELGTVLGQLGTAFAQLFAQLIPAILPMAMQIFQTIIPMAVQLFAQLANTWIQIASTVLPMVLQAITMIMPMVLQIIQTVVPLIIQIFLQIVPVILQIAQTVIPLILQAVQLVFPVVMQIIQLVVPIVIQILMTIVPIITMIAQTVIPLIMQAVQLVFPIIMQIISMAVPIITNLLQFVAQVITGVLVPTIKIILQVVQAVFPVVLNVVETVINAVSGVINAVMSALQGDWEGAWNAIKGVAETIMNGIIGFFESIDLFEIGKNIIQGLVDGISGMAGAAIDKVKEVGSNIKDTLVSFFDINSPSKVMRMDVGRHIGSGLALGMDDSQKGIIRAANDMAAAAMPNIAAGTDLSTQLEVATNMQIPTVPGLYTTLDVGTNFDGKQPPSYAASNVGDINPGGAGRTERSRGRTVIVQKLIDKMEIIADKDLDIEEFVDELIDKLLEKLEDADEILGNADMEVLL